MVGIHEEFHAHPIRSGQVSQGVSTNVCKAIVIDPVSGTGMKFAAEHFLLIVRA